MHRYKLGNVLDNRNSKSKSVVVAIKENRNGTHLKTVNVDNGFLGHLNDVYSEQAKGIYILVSETFEQYELKTPTMKHWIEVKVMMMMNRPY